MARTSSSSVATIIAVAIVVLGAGLAVFALSSSDKTAKKSTASESASSSSTNNSTPIKATTTGDTIIRFTDKGFDKSEYTSKAGEAVTVKNESSMDLEFSSDDHPTHRDHPEMNMDTLAPGKSGTVTPAGAGTYMFHDHIHDEYTGTLTVQ